MTIQEAIEAARARHTTNSQGDCAITRREWNEGECLIIPLAWDSDIRTEVRDLWTPTLADLTAHDWDIYADVPERQPGL